MNPIFVTLPTSQPPMSWLKAAAPLNMLEHACHIRHIAHLPVADVLVKGGGAIEHAAIFVTLPTSQPPMSWLKAAAPLNMAAHIRHIAHIPAADVLVKGGGRMPSIFEHADVHIRHIFLPTSQPLMSPLKATADGAVKAADVGVKAGFIEHVTHSANSRKIRRIRRAHPHIFGAIKCPQLCCSTARRPIVLHP